MSPEHTKCPQCGTKFPYSKRSKTLAGKLESLFERVGRVVVIGGAALVLILLLAGGIYLYRHFGGTSQVADQAAHVETIVNTSFDVSTEQPASFQIVVPSGASNAGSSAVTRSLLDLRSISTFLMQVNDGKLLKRALAP